MNFSPDGKYVLSGDSEGRCFFWEWAHPHKIMRTIKAHDGVCIACAWHPMETSKVVTAGWDGAIKVRLVRGRGRGFGFTGCGRGEPAADACLCWPGWAER